MRYPIQSVISNKVIWVDISASRDQPEPFKLGLAVMAAVVQGESLAGCHLDYVDLSGMHLASASGKYTDMDGTHLASVSLWKHSLDFVDFSGASMVGANFKGANLRGVVFTGANLDGAKFERADLTDADVTNTVLDPFSGLKKHHPDNCPKRVTGSCGCDGAYDDGCPKCTPDRHTNWCPNCNGAKR